MTIICQQIGTISGTNSLLCGKLIRVYDIRPWYETIDVLIEGQISPQVGDNGFTIGSERYRLVLVSKNVAAGTATVQLTISTVEVPPPPPVSEGTHHLDLYLKPYSWYSAGGAADELATKLVDINGAILDLFYRAGITDYQYVGTSILTEPDKPGIVTIRIKLQQTSAMSLDGSIESMVVIPLAVWIAAIVAAVLVFCIFLGFISGWSFTLSGAIAQITGKKYSDKEVVDIIATVVTDQLDECNKNYADPNAAAGCQKAVICGANNGIADALKTGVDCTKLAINDKIDKCLEAYNTDGDKVKYDACVRTVAKDSGDEQKDNLPDTTDWTTLALVGLGAIALVSMSKGSGSQPIYIKESVVEKKEPLTKTEARVIQKRAMR